MCINALEYSVPEVTAIFAVFIFDGILYSSRMTPFIVIASYFATLFSKQGVHYY